MGFLSKIFGSKVKVPEFKAIDIDQEILNNISSTQENVPQAAELATSIGEGQADAALATLERLNPGTGKIIKQMTNNILSAQRGEIPQDVVNLVQDRAAARNFGRGIGGTEAAENITLRDLGLTSLDRINQGQAQAAQALQLFSGMAPTPNISSFFLRPQERLAFLQNERNQRYNRDLTAAQVKAQPNPVLGAIGGTLLGAAGTALGVGGGLGLASMLGGGAASGLSGLAGGKGSGAGTKFAMTAAQQDQFFSPEFKY